jgi:hypothetical protein
MNLFEFDKPYDRDKFLDFMIDFLPDDFTPDRTPCTDRFHTEMCPASHTIRRI